MSDLFHEQVPDEFVAAVVSTMQLASWHTYQVLTKRPERMLALLEAGLGPVDEHPHIWWGVSVEDRRHGLPRIDVLRNSPVHTRFLSIEPLLEDLGEIGLEGIDWVIVGGESGSGARPMEAWWVRSLRDQCSSAGVPFFFKQWGGVRKGEAGRRLDGRTYSQFPPGSRMAMPELSERRVLRQQVEDQILNGF